MINPDGKYVFGWDKAERDRLNAQHKLLTKVTNKTLVDPAVPKENVFSVADVGTGTGIWLKDLAASLDRPVDQAYYHGFDISAAQFPTDEPANMRFSVHDITKPFPDEHLGRYDLVHVRLLVAAIEEPDYRLAIDNLAAMLKPGGYLQWEEIDEETYKSERNPVVWEMHRCYSTALAKEGKCFAASAKVFEECKEGGLEDVQRLEYASEVAAQNDPTLQSDVDKRIPAMIETLYASLLLRSGQVPDKQAAKRRADALIEQHWELCRQGNSPGVKIMRVVARKPVCTI
ncbi:LaeA-like methyltransferase [Aspergillus unguis]